jgi:hypothetical protein
MSPFSWKGVQRSLKSVGGGAMHFDIRVDKNLTYEGGSQSQPRYFFEVDMSSVLPGEGRTARLPVFWRPNPARHPLVKELYWTQILGTTVEKGNLDALERVVPEAIEAVVDYGTLPYYLLSLPIWDKLPIYLSGDKLCLHLPDGPTLTAEDIGQLWRRLGDHLLGIGKLHSRQEIAVRIVLWKDLQTYPMALALGNGNVWIPIFSHPGSEGFRLNYDAIGVPSRFLDVADVFALRREVAADLAERRAIMSPFELRMDQVGEDVWEALQSYVSPSGYVLSYFGEEARVQMPVYEVDGEAFAVDRNSKPSLIFSPDFDELLRHVTEELIRARRLPRATILTLEAAAPQEEGGPT